MYIYVFVCVFVSVCLYACIFVNSEYIYTRIYVCVCEGFMTRLSFICLIFLFVRFMGPSNCGHNSAEPCLGALHF